jgi:hypothetical protein
MFRDLVYRLGNPLPLGSRALKSPDSHAHGCLRRDQGYTAAMMVEEARMLQVSIFLTLQRHVEETESGVPLLYIMAIADEVACAPPPAQINEMSAVNECEVQSRLISILLPYSHSLSAFAFHCAAGVHMQELF